MPSLVTSLFSVHWQEWSIWNVSQIMSLIYLISCGRATFCSEWVIKIQFNWLFSVTILYLAISIYISHTEFLLLLKPRKEYFHLAALPFPGILSPSLWFLNPSLSSCPWSLPWPLNVKLHSVPIPAHNTCFPSFWSPLCVFLILLLIYTTFYFWYLLCIFYYTARM